MRIFAYYLPQFHVIPENDKWWGSGFTEWTNVKRAKPLYRGHKQPKIPLNGNYYNLMDKEQIIRQTDTAREYGIDGFIYYHYYFNGKLLLEKPAENFLQWKEIQHNYFFCWANHSWIRSWNESREILVEQKYGTADDWEKHFEYLLPFFKDDRYEKIHNKPVFMIFKCDFPEKEPMMSFFDNKCRLNGFDGIYVIESSTASDKDDFLKQTSSKTGAITRRQPDTCIKDLLKKHENDIAYHTMNRMQKVLLKSGCNAAVKKYDANKLYDCMMEEISEEHDEIPESFFEWDNTPRHGRNGYVITPPDKAEFTEYMNLIRECPYLFINSWNEWAEGTMIEPTQDTGYRYLEWIKEYKFKKM